MEYTNFLGYVPPDVGNGNHQADQKLAGAVAKQVVEELQPWIQREKEEHII